MKEINLCVNSTIVISDLTAVLSNVAKICSQTKYNNIQYLGERIILPHFVWTISEHRDHLTITNLRVFLRIKRDKN
jgi:hypothetical protein